MLIWIFAYMKVQAQEELSPEMRRKFVDHQTDYFVRINLSENQKRNYEEITRRYDKRILNVNWSELKKAAKKKRIRSLNKRKNTEMKALLANDQYKLYLLRQKEIRKDYEE